MIENELNLDYAVELSSPDYQMTLGFNGDGPWMATVDATGPEEALHRALEAAHSALVASGARNLRWFDAPMHGADRPAHSVRVRLAT